MILFNVYYVSFVNFFKATVQSSDVAADIQLAWADPRQIITDPPPPPSPPIGQKNYLKRSGIVTITVINKFSDLNRAVTSTFQSYHHITT